MVLRKELFLLRHELEKFRRPHPKQPIGPAEEDNVDYILSTSLHCNVCTLLVEHNEF